MPKSLQDVAPVSDAEPLVLRLELGEGELRDRLLALLAGVDGLRLAAPGEPADAAVVSPEPASDDAAADAFALTPREREVLAIVAEGASNREVARRLGISVHTAKFHVGQLLDKLDATGRLDAVAHAARRGVLHL